MSEKDLSSYQLGHVVHVAMTSIQLHTHQNKSVNRDDALAIAADVGRRSVETVQAWERDLIKRPHPPTRESLVK